VNPTDPAKLAYSNQNLVSTTTTAGQQFSPVTRWPLLLTGGDTSTAFDGQGSLFWTNLDLFTNGINIVQLDPASGVVIAGPFQVDVPPSNISGNFSDDKEWLAADPVTNNLYVAWTQFGPFGSQVLLTRSTNQGQTWGPTVKVSPDPPFGQLQQGLVQQLTVAVGPDSTVYVAYHSEPGYISGNPSGNRGQTIVQRYSNDLSIGLSTTAAFGQGQSDVTFNYQDYPRTIPGTTFWTIGSSQPYILPDPARPGNIYVVAADDPNNGAGGTTDPADVVLARSTDYGVTWTTSTIDSGVPVAGMDSSFQLFPTAAIDPFGDIVVAWYDNRDGNFNAAGHYLLDVYARYSTDGGLTWSPAFQVNDANHHFDPDANPDKVDGHPGTTRIGEYFGVALYGGTAYVDWNGNTVDSSGNATGQQVFTKSFGIQGSLHVFDDNPNANTISIARIPGGALDSIQVLVNGQPEYAGRASALTGGIFVILGSGTNIINIEQTLAGVPIYVDALHTPGTDTVNIAPSTGSLENIQGPVFVNGDSVNGSGSVDLVVDDQNNPDILMPTQDTITDTSLTRVGFASDPYTGQPSPHIASINYSGLSGLTFATGNLPAYVYVESTSVPTTVNAGIGTLAMYIAPQTENLDNLQGAVTVNGSGSVALVVDDQNNPDILMPTQDTITDTSLTRVGFASDPVTGQPSPHIASINYSGLRSLTFTTGGLPAFVDIESTSVPTTVNAGIGTLAMYITPQTENLDNLQGFLTVNGSGSVALVVDDQNNPNDLGTDDYITGTWLTRVGFYTGTTIPHIASINYSGLSSLTFATGSLFSVCDVESTSVQTTVNAGIGTMDMIIAPQTENLDNLQGALTVNGRGSVALLVDDQNNPDILMPTQDTVTGTSLTRVGFASDPFTGQPSPHIASINYSGLRSLEFNTGGLPAYVYVESTSVQTTVNAGIGTLAMYIAPQTENLDKLQGALTVNGRGSVALLVDDQNNPDILMPTQDTITGTSLTRVGFASDPFTGQPSPHIASINYSGLSSLTFATGGLPAYVYVESTSVPTTVNAGIGTLAIYITPQAENLDNLQGAVTVNGSGSVGLVVDDQNNAATVTYTITATSVSRAGSAGVTYSGVAAVVLNGGSGGNLFILAQTNMPVSLNGGAGDDTFEFNDGASITGSIDGGGGFNTLDYRAYTTPVTVNLLTGIATGVAGGVRNIQRVLGGVQVFTATNKQDSGPGSLRQSIIDADARATPSIIDFDIPGSGAQTIAVGSTTGLPLPDITAPVTIDGYSQPGASPNTLSAGNNAVLLVQLDGGSAGPNANGLTITGGNSTVQGLVINRFSGDGIQMTGNGATGNLVAGNYLGTDPSGTVALGNLGNGVTVQIGANKNTIGGTTPGARNVISGNGGNGIYLLDGYVLAGNYVTRNTANNVIQGNFIGTDATGNVAVGNGNDGVFLDIVRVSETVGGTAPGAGNLISGNHASGIVVGAFDGSFPGVQPLLIQGNRIGTNLAGTAPLGNWLDGIILGADAFLTVGGHAPGAGNLISANGRAGIDGFVANYDTIQGNLIGTDISGMERLGNQPLGIYLGISSINVVGGTSPAERNIIAGNSAHQIVIDRINNSEVVPADGNVIEGNFIGVNASGATALGGSGAGVYMVDGAVGNIIGGMAPGAGNVIGGNATAGVLIRNANLQDPTVGGNFVEANFIGTDISGSVPLGNGVGVLLDQGASSNTIGGSATGAGNIIAFNTGGGVVVGDSPADNTAVANAIRANSIYANGGLGIDLGNDGVTPNHTGSGTGPNNFQNFPVLAEFGNASTTVVTGTLNSLANTTYTLDFFANESPDSSGYGEGQTYLGSTTATTDSSGNATFSVTFNLPFSPTQFITATATDPAGNTSEFAHVADLPLAATGTAIHASEGIAFSGVVASFTDTDPNGSIGQYTASVSWGDGSASTFGAIAQPGSGFVVNGTHTYPEEGSYTITVTIRDQGSSQASATSTATVAVVAPTGNITGPTSSVPGQPRTFTFAATDPSPIDQVAGFNYAINWGDGSPVQTVSRAPGNGSGVAVDHIYTSTGSYSIQLTATEDGGSSGTATQSVIVQTVQMQGNSLAVGGTLSNDTIVLSPADAVGDINVNLNSSSLGNFRPTDHIFIYGQSGNDTIQLVSKRFSGTIYYITVPAFIYGGGTGNETLSTAGSTSNNVVIGGGGTNQITGGLGRDLLIAGLGSSKLFAGSGQDILVAGTTDYDLTSTAMTYDRKLQALEAIMAEWGRNDLGTATDPTGYLARVNDLLGPSAGGTSGGLNGSYFLNSMTVHSNGVSDTLFGAGTSQLDWFFASILEVKNKQSSDIVTNIS
jgi:hypothetical protein